MKKLAGVHRQDLVLDCEGSKERGHRHRNEVSLGCGIYIYEAQLHFHTGSFMRDQGLWCDIGELDHPSAGGGRHARGRNGENR